MGYGFKGQGHIAFIQRSGSSALNSPIAASPHLYEAQLLPSPLAPSVVQSIGNNAGYSPTSKTVALAFSAANTAGNLIILSINWGNYGIHVASITDAHANTYTNITG